MYHICYKSRTPQLHIMLPPFDLLNLYRWISGSRMLVGWHWVMQPAGPCRTMHDCCDSSFILTVPCHPQRNTPRVPNVVATKSATQDLKQKRKCAANASLRSLLFALPRRISCSGYLSKESAIHTKRMDVILRRPRLSLLPSVSFLSEPLLFVTFSSFHFFLL